MVRVQLWVSEHVSFPLQAYGDAAGPSALGQGLELSCLRKTGSFLCSQVPKTERDDACTAQFCMEGSCGFSQGDKSIRGVGHAAEAPSSSSGWLFGSSFQQHHGFSCCPSIWLQRRARAVELGEAAGLSMFTWPLCTCTGLELLPLGHRSAPLRGHRTPEPPVCRHDEVPKQPSEHGLGTSDGNAKLFILKCCRH